MDVLEFNTILSLLNKKAGFDPDVVRRENIKRAVENRMTYCGAPDMKAYLPLLINSAREMGELIEEVIVPETWFLRDREPFKFLENYIKTDWQPNQFGKILRVLSVPCSTGEEPYSIAMTLLLSGLSTKEFQIEAVDISNESLAKAKNAVYGKNSFRGAVLGPYWQYFKQEPEGLKVVDEVAEVVSFSQGNILDGFNVVADGIFDIIFCRNLLIYLDKDAKQKLIKILDQRLSMNGIMFLGHAETGIISDSRFNRVDHERAFAFKRKVHEKKQTKTVDHKPFSAIKTGRKKIRMAVSKIPEKVALPIHNELDDKHKHKHKNKPNLQSSIEKASLLADRGRLDEAMAICQDCLSSGGPNAEAYFILGLINHASGNDVDAEQYFNKTIYLQPDHYDALVHIALIMENRHDVDSANVLRQRAQRAKQKNG